MSYCGGGPGSQPSPGSAEAPAERVPPHTLLIAFFLPPLPSGPAAIVKAAPSLENLDSSRQVTNPEAASLNGAARRLRAAKRKAQALPQAESTSQQSPPRGRLNVT